MKWMYLAACALALATACDSNQPVDGSRSPCASGGAIGGCPSGDESPAGACTRLVSCGAIPLAAPDDKYDWGRCVDQLNSMTAERRGFVTACIATSSCDELRVNGSPTNPYQRIFCFEFGVQ
jgi:hypothetical protein